MSQIALTSGPNEVNQLEATINALIATINGYLNGVTPMVGQVTAASTGAQIPNNGIVTFGSTAVKSYVLAAPVLGQMVQFYISKTTTNPGTNVTMASTLITIGTTFKKLVMKTKNQALIMVGLSTTKWGIVSNVGTVVTTS